MISLEIVKERISTANKRNLLLVNLSKEELQQIEKDLEILSLIVKWKNTMDFNKKSQYAWYLTDTEFKIMINELVLIENYLAHYIGYTPKLFKKDGDSNE